MSKLFSRKKYFIILSFVMVFVFGSVTISSGVPVRAEEEDIILLADSSLNSLFIFSDSSLRLGSSGQVLSSGSWGYSIRVYKFDFPVLCSSQNPTGHVFSFVSDSDQISSISLNYTLSYSDSFDSFSSDFFSFILPPNTFLYVSSNSVNFDTWFTISEYQPSPTPEVTPSPSPTPPASPSEVGDYDKFFYLIIFMIGGLLTWNFATRSPH